MDAIPEKIRDYLKGLLSETERQDMEESIRNDAALRQEVAYARLLMAGLERHVERKTRRRNRVYWFFLMITILLLVLVLLWRFFQPAPPSNDSTGSILQQTGSTESNTEFGESGRSIAISKSGEIYFVGEFLGDIIIKGKPIKNNGLVDVLMARLDQNLNFEWDKEFSSPFLDKIYKIVIDNTGDLVITGTIGTGAVLGDTLIQSLGRDDYGERDLFVAKFSPLGELKWIYHTGGHRIDYQQTGINAGFGIAIDSHNDILFTGMYIGDPMFQSEHLPTGGGNGEFVLAKLSPKGKVKWLQTGTGDRNVFGFNVELDRYDNVYAAGHFAHNNLNGFVNFGSDTLVTYGGPDIFLVKYDPAGNLVWAKHAGSNVMGYGCDSAMDLATDTEGNSFICGFYSGTAKFDDLSVASIAGSHDIFIAKYNPDGKAQWVKSAGSSANLEYGKSIALDEFGNAYMTGTFQGIVNFQDTMLISLGGSDAFVAKYSPDGNLVWALSFGGETPGSEMDVGVDIKVISEDKIVITGYFSGTMQLPGMLPITSRGKTDIFILTIDRHGQILSLHDV